ncbi:MAG: hypothetical protein AAF602_16865 [Myxococcota bacterium]
MDDAFRVVVVEGLDHLDPTSLTRVQALRPDRLALSNTVARSTPRRWRDASRVLTTLAPAWPTVGGRDRRGDPKLRGVVATWPGIGVPVLSDPVPWYGVDVVTGDVRWRWVVLDSNADALGTGWLDQRSWLPKVVSDRDVDRFVIALDAGPGRDAAGLLDLVRDHAPADKVVLVVAFGTRQPGFVPIGGRWGEGRLAAGALPAGGWWVVELTEPGLRITAERPLGTPVVHDWSPDRGWGRRP